MKLLLKFLLLTVVLTAMGCISWDEGWKSRNQPSGQGNVKELLASAGALEGTADSAEKIKHTIAAYEKVTAIEPDNFEALTKLSEYLFINGYIYTNDRKERGEYYLRSLKYSEQAMYTNPKFKELADNGKSVWEALDALAAREVAPMYWWYMSAGQYWTDKNSLVRLFNFYWPKRAKATLERMTELQPDWNYGRIYMAWACYYAVVPGFLGGDVKKSAENFDKAIQLGPDVLTHYYNRARYLHSKTGDKEAFKKDLETVLSKEITKINCPYRWGFAYHMKAKELLAKTDALF